MTIRTRIYFGQASRTSGVMVSREAHGCAPVIVTVDDPGPPSRTIHLEFGDREAAIALVEHVWEVLVDAEMQLDSGEADRERALDHSRLLQGGQA